MLFVGHCHKAQATVKTHSMRCRMDTQVPGRCSCHKRLKERTPNPPVVTGSLHEKQRNVRTLQCQYPYQRISIKSTKNCHGTNLIGIFNIAEKCLHPLLRIIRGFKF